MAAATAASKEPEALKRRQQSKITNNVNLLPGLAGSSTWAKRMRDIMRAQIADLGGEENVSTAEANLIRRAAALSVQAELLEVEFALAQKVDPETVDIYGRITSHLRRLFESVGLKRRPRVVGTSLGDLMLDDLARQRQAVEIDVVASKDQQL